MISVVKVKYDEFGSRLPPLASSALIHPTFPTAPQSARLHLGGRRRRRPVVAPGKTPEVSGLFKLRYGGPHRTYSRTLVLRLCVTRWVSKRRMEFIDMPTTLKGQYQSYTQATMDRLRSAGYAGSIHIPGRRVFVAMCKNISSLGSFYH